MKKTSTARAVVQIDAAGQSMGRVATRIVTVLCGKNRADYNPRIDAGSRVLVINVGKVSFSGRKLEQKDIRHHTMFPGGLKEIPMKRLFIKDPRLVLRHAINGMLPKNNRRPALMRRLTLEV